jgi:N-acetylneuraminic acid mutarotase
MKKPQKMEDYQFNKELPIWMKSMIQWMDHKMKSCQQPPQGRQAWVIKEADIHPFRGNGLT